MEKLAVAENFPNTAMTVITMGRSDGQTKKHISRSNMRKVVFLGKLFFLHLTNLPLEI